MRKILFFLFLCIINIIFGTEEDEADSMNYIIDNIYLGDIVAASNETFLKEYNISIVINCAIEFESNYKDLKALELKLYDSIYQNLFPKFEYAYKIIKQYQKTNILIHCMAGVSRSASLVIFYIMKEKKWDYDKSFEYVQRIRDFISPNLSFIDQLKEYYDKYIK